MLFQFLDFHFSILCWSSPLRRFLYRFFIENSSPDIPKTIPERSQNAPRPLTFMEFSFESVRKRFWDTSKTLFKRLSTPLHVFLREFQETSTPHNASQRFTTSHNASQLRISPKNASQVRPARPRTITDSSEILWDIVLFVFTVSEGSVTISFFALSLSRPPAQFSTVPRYSETLFSLCFLISKALWQLVSLL